VTVEPELCKEPFSVDKVDTAKGVALWDKEVRAKITAVQSVHSKLCEGLLENQAEHIGMIGWVEVCIDPGVS